MKDKYTDMADDSIKNLNTFRWGLLYMAAFLSMFSFGTIAALFVLAFALGASSILEYARILKFLHIRQLKEEEKQKKEAFERVAKGLELLIKETEKKKNEER